MSFQEKVSQLKPTAVKRLRRELNMIEVDDEYHITVEVLHDQNNNEDLSRWIVSFAGPMDSPFHKHRLHALIEFPEDYPISPFKFTFISKLWHPNVYPNGKMCISILQTQNDDLGDHYLRNVTWTPVNTVRLVVISICVVLNEPNIDSPANIDACNMYKKANCTFNEEYQTIVNKALKSSPNTKDFIKTYRKH